MRRGMQQLISPVRGGSDHISSVDDAARVCEERMIRTMIITGVCGFHTTVAARSDDMQMVTLQITSDCEKIRRLAEALAIPIDSYQEIGDGWDGVILKAASSHLKGCCAGCAVPCGVCKSVQVAGGIALPALVSFTMERVEEDGRAREIRYFHSGYR